jgi:hypothetical protein
MPQEGRDETSRKRPQAYKIRKEHHLRIETTNYFAFNNTHDTNTYSICTDITGIVVYWDKIERPCSGMCREVVLMDTR